LTVTFNNETNIVPRKETFSPFITISNTGTELVSNIQASITVPAGFRLKDPQNVNVVDLPAGASSSLNWEVKASSSLGSYPITVSVSDASGNTVDISYMITIEAAK